MTSRLRSLRLCAFSVLSARIRNASPSSGETSAVICLRPEHLGGGEAMPAVRRAELALLAAHHDDRVEERSRLVDLLREALGVRRREVALEGRRLHRRERQRGHQHGAAGQRLAIGADRRAAALAHLRGERRDALVVDRQRDVRGVEAAPVLARREGLAAGPALPGRLCFALRSCSCAASARPTILHCRRLSD